MKKNLILFSVIAVILVSCKRERSDSKTESNCFNIEHVTITATNTVTIGETIKFGVPEVGGYRIYDWRGPDNYMGQEPEDSITDCNLEHEGWYYLHLSSLDDNSCVKIDSVYIDVKLKQGTPACSITNNTCDYN